jgi:hypothetical protein
MITKQENFIHKRTQNPQIKSTAKQVKFTIYHMSGCPHCDVIMKGSPSIFSRLKNEFKNHPNVQFLQYQSGKDKEANGYTSFPTIKLAHNNKDEFYEGERSFEGMRDAIKRVL